MAKNFYGTQHDLYQKVATSLAPDLINGIHTMTTNECNTQGLRSFGMEIELEFSDNDCGCECDWNDDCDCDSIESDRDGFFRALSNSNLFDLVDDGSLNYGAEVVTYPMDKPTLQGWLLNSNDVALMSRSLEADTRTNGVHVHINKLETDCPIKMMALLSKVQDQLQEMTRVSRWARPINGSLARALDINRSCTTHSLYYLLREHNDNCKSVILNTSQEHTWEFRVFNKTSNRSRLALYVDFVESFLATAHEMTLEDILVSDFLIDCDTWLISVTGQDTSVLDKAIERAKYLVETSTRYNDGSNR